jgi:FkbM family methyltransferase
VGGFAEIRDWKWLLRTRIVRGRLLWLYRRRYERTVKRKLRTIKGDVFWDIGANIGFYSVMLSGNFKKIVAVEPNPATAATLRNRTRRNSHIEILELALSDKNGPAFLYTQEEAFCLAGFNNRNGSDSLLSRIDYKSARDPSNDRVVQNRPSIQVFQRRFDELNTGTVDLVKVDVEGAEFLVLEGMRNSLKDRLVKRVIVELHNRERKTELESFFADYGYGIEWVDPDHLFAKAP